MSYFWTLLKGIGLGAGAMYLFDPEHGPTRRSRLRSEVMRASLAIADEADRLVSTSAEQLLECAQKKGCEVAESVLPIRDPVDQGPAAWPPSSRLLAGTVGGLLLAYGATRRAPTACVLGTAGLALLAEGLIHRSRQAQPDQPQHEPAAPGATAEQSVDNNWHVATP